DGGTQPSAPFDWQGPAHRCDADEHGGRAPSQTKAFLEVAHYRDAPAEAQHVLDRLAGRRAVKHADHPLGHIANAAIRRLRRHRLELPVGEDEEFHAMAFVFGTGNSPVGRSTAGSSSAMSP